MTARRWLGVGISATVTRGLRVEVPGGSVGVEVVSLEALGVDRLAAAHLPAGGDPEAMIALDSDGGELQRVELGPRP